MRILFKIIYSLFKNKINKFYNRYDINFIDYTSNIENPYKIVGGSNIFIGSNTNISEFSWIEAVNKYHGVIYDPKIIIGSNVCIGKYSCITAIDFVEIEDNVLISEYLYLSDHFHDVNPGIGLSPIQMPLGSKGKVKVGKNSFIGYRVSILSGVTIGENCVVGANSVVTKSFPNNVMVAGVPARILKIFSFEKNAWIDY